MRGRGGLAALALLGLVSVAQAAGLQASAGLARALAGNGRAEATLRFLTPGIRGVPRAVHATLALEPPDRARMDVTVSGEKIVARGDGGEWLQPSTRQMLRFPPERSAAALRWWRVLLATGGAARERRIAEGRFVVTLLGEGGAGEDSAEVWLDAHGLPSRLVVPAGDPDAAVYRLSSWRFTRARGAVAFRLSAPRGFEVVDVR